jgi:hypothetical protein
LRAFSRIILETSIATILLHLSCLDNLCRTKISNAEVGVVVENYINTPEALLQCRTSFMQNHKVVNCSTVNMGLNKLTGEVSSSRTAAARGEVVKEGTEEGVVGELSMTILVKEEYNTSNTSPTQPIRNLGNNDHHT